MNSVDGLTSLHRKHFFSRGVIGAPEALSTPPACNQRDFGDASPENDRHDMREFWRGETHCDGFWRSAGRCGRWSRENEGCCSAGGRNEADPAPDNRWPACAADSQRMRVVACLRDCACSKWLNTAGNGVIRTTSNIKPLNFVSKWREVYSLCFRV